MILSSWDKNREKLLGQFWLFEALCWKKLWASLEIEKNQPPTTKKPRISTLSLFRLAPGVCPVLVGTLRWAGLGMSGGSACPAPSPDESRFPLQAYRASAVSPTSSPALTGSALPFFTLSLRLPCPPWARSLSNATPPPRSAGEP